MQDADHRGQYSSTFFLEALTNWRVSNGAAQRQGSISPKLTDLTCLHRHISTWTIGCSAPSPLQPIDSLHQCLLPTSASSFHGSKTSGKQVCIEINAEQQWSSFSGKRICVGSNDERQQRISLSIHEFGDLVAAPIPLLETQNIVSWLKGI